MPTTFRSMTEFSDPDFPLNVTFKDDGSFTLEWDEEHPVTSIFNTWTEKDFIDVIMKQCRETLGKEEFDRINASLSEE